MYKFECNVERKFYRDGWGKEGGRGEREGLLPNMDFCLVRY